MKIILFLPVLMAMLLLSCNPGYTPKPRGYYRIDFPEKKYQPLDVDLPFGFLFPEYAEISRYSGQFRYDPDAESWLNIDFPDFSAHIHLTYKSIRNNLGTLIEDAHTFAFKHSMMAEAINQVRYDHDERNVHCLVFEIKGNTASNVQFFCTDSLRHFIRGALYFDTEPNKDSLSPVIDFMYEDIKNLMESLEWKK